MAIKKRITLILVTVLALAILVTGITLTTFAEETEGIAFRVEHTDGTVTEYAPEGDASLTTQVRAGNAFAKVISNARDGDKITALMDFDIPSGDHQLNFNATLDLGGKTVTPSGRILVQPAIKLTVQNGTINKTNKEFIYMGEWGTGVSDTTVELKDVTIKKAVEAPNTCLFDVRAGSIIFDNVTANDGEYTINPKASHISVIHAGYKTRTLDQPINIEVKNSNIYTSGTSFITSLGASDQDANMGGYVLNIDIKDSVVDVDHYILLANPSADVAAKSAINITATGSTKLTSDTPVKIPETFLPQNVNIMIGYGVTTKKPRPEVGTVTLGEDGNGLLDLRSLSDTKNIGIVRDLWADDYTPVTDSAYSFVIVGDTQMTVDFDPDNLHYIYDWILDNKETKNIQYVFGMGDITNNSLDTEWSVAYEQITRLDGNVPYSLVIGNHDTSASYNETFNNETYKSMFDGFYSEDKIENSYVTFTVGDVKYLHITLDWKASNAVLNWASSIIEHYYDHLVIISTHAYLNNDGNLLTQGESDDGSTNSGEQMWNKLVSRYENVFLVLSGHRFTTDLVYRQATGVHGNVVTEIMTNGQCIDLKNDAMGLISILSFSEDGKTISVEYYSTVYDRYFGKNSQFTLSVPEYNSENYEAYTPLYEVTDANGNTFTLSDERTPSLVFASIESGSTVKLLGDVTLNSTTTIINNITIDLGGHKITTVGRFNVKSTFTVKNGTIVIDEKELVYVEEGNTKANVTFANVDLVHTEKSAKKALAEVRDGSITLDNVRCTAENWKGTSNLLTVAARTKKVGQSIYITIQNSNIDLGTSGCTVINFPTTSGETKGYTGYVTITNSTVKTSGKLLTAKTNTAVDNCAINASIDKDTVINCGTVFALSSLKTDKISVSIATGARFTAIPNVEGVSFDGTDVFIYDSTDELLYAAKLDEVDTSVAGCKLVNADGELVCLWNGTVINQELLTYAQNAACDVVLLGNMTTPAGTSSSARYSMTVTIGNLTIDLNGHTLNMGAYCYFGTASSSKVLTIKNGTVKHSYTVFYSYTGSNTSGFTAIGVKFFMSGYFASFDHRIGVLTLTDCEIKNTSTNTSSSKYIFTLGNTTRKDPVVVNISGCTITSSAAKSCAFETFSGQPCTVNVENSTISVAARIIYASADKGKNPADVFNFKNCTISQTGDGSLFNIKYETLTVNLDEVYVPTGNNYQSTTGTVTIAKGQTTATVAQGGYMITAPKIKIEANLTLYVDFTLNVWLPTDTAVTLLNVGGTDYRLSELDVVNGRYRIKVESISASEAADVITILITYTDGDKTLTVEKAYSVIEYAKSIIENEKYSSEAKSLLASVVDYVSSVYTYDKKALPDMLTTLIGSDAYKNALELGTSDGTATVPTTTTDIGTAKNAISGARLSLGNTVDFVFTVNPEYTGPITLSYAGRLYECEAVNGKIGENDYIRINMRAFDLFDEVITITAGEYSGTYDLAAYIAVIRTEYETEESLEALLISLYNYCKEANEYKAYITANGGALN